MGSSNDVIEASEPRQSTLWGFWATLLWGTAILLIATVFQILAILVLMLWRNSEIWKSPSAEWSQAVLSTADGGLGLSLATLVALVVHVGLIAGVIKLKRRSALRAYLGFNPVSIVTLRNWCSLLVGFLAILEVLGLALGRPGMPEFIATAYATARPVWLLWVAVVVAAPLSEELLFRGFLLKGFAASFMGPTAAVLTTSAAWTALHTQYDAYDLTTIFILGLLFGAARLITGSLLVPLTLHAVANLLATADVAFSR
jgi:uncharacterized protein